jgi:hypothetical protein
MAKKKTKDETRVERTISFQDMCAYARVLARRGDKPDPDWEDGNQFKEEYRRELSKTAMTEVEDAFDGIQEYVTSHEAIPSSESLRKAWQHLKVAQKRLAQLLDVVDPQALLDLKNSKSPSKPTKTRFGGGAYSGFHTTVGDDDELDPDEVDDDGIDDGDDDEDEQDDD